MILRLLYVWARNRHVERFLRGTHRGPGVQHEVLWSKVRRNADSAFGRDHGFADMKSLADFRKRVPITTYEYYRPYVERLKKGEVGAMFGGGTKLLMFALTSGTTDKAKYIPITQEFLDEYRRGWNLWGVRVYRDHPRLLRLYNMQLTSDWKQFYTEGGTPCGNISGLASETAPLISRPIFINPRPVMKITDPVAKQYTALRITMSTSKVGVLMTANPSTLVEFARLADTQNESLIRDIFDGNLSREFDVPENVRQMLGRKITRSRPRRARQLERIAEQHGRLLPRDFWPRMELLGCWIGGSVGAYIPRLKEFYGDVAVRDHGLSASEGRMTMPIADGTSVGVLDYETQFFEFIPEDEHDRPDPTVLEAHEIEAGKNYYIVLTTSSGFYRYDIHDLVRCVGFEGRVPLLEFLNKGAHFSSVTGEKLSELQATMAVQKAFSELGLTFEHFTVAPQWGDPPGYQLLMEPGVHSGHEHELAARIDGHLAQLNCEYANRLETGRLRPLQIMEIPRGTWRTFRQRRVAQVGGSIEQYKHPCLANDLGFIEKVVGAGAGSPGSAESVR